jgi:DNA-binding response OmpR family regulator
MWFERAGILKINNLILLFLVFCMYYVDKDHILENQMTHVLLVEDDQKVSAFIKNGLEEHGYFVEAVYTGMEAIDCIETVVFDLVILDLYLPEEDGLSVYRSLRNKGCQTPILKLKTQIPIDDRGIKFDIGADDCLVKPFEIKDILAKLGGMVRHDGEGNKNASVKKS